MAVTAASPKSTNLQAESFAAGDPVLNRLVQIGLWPFVMSSGFMVVLFALRFFAAWRVGHHLSTDDVTGFLETPAQYTALVGGTVILAYYIWMPKGIVRLFSGLYRNKVIGGPTEAHNSECQEQSPHDVFLADMKQSFGRWWWSASVAGITTVSILVLYIPTIADPSYRTEVADVADDVSMILTVLWAWIIMYVVLQVLFFTTLTVVWLYRLFKNFTIVIRPLYPDGAGGLSPLGDFSLTLSYLTTLVGLFLVIVPITRNYAVEHTLDFRWTIELVASLVAYIFVSPLVFFGPLTVAHAAMQTAKNDLLQQIARRFERELERIQRALDDDILDADRGILAEQEAQGRISDGLKQLRDLQDLHNTAQRFPVWPLNTKNLVRFFTTFVSPVILRVAVDAANYLIDIGS